MKTNEKHCITLSKSILVPYCQKHVQRYHEWMKSEELQELTASEPLTLEEEYQMQISWHEDDKKCTFIILDKAKCSENFEDEKSVMIGDVNLFFNDMESCNSAELEIMIAEPEARGKGIGKQAALAMMYYGITTLDVDAFTAKIGYKNMPSIILFNKLGFTEVSKSEVFQEVTLKLDITDQAKDSIKSMLGEYVVGEYTDLPS